MTFEIITSKKAQKFKALTMNEKSAWLESIVQITYQCMGEQEKENESLNIKNKAQEANFFHLDDRG